MVTQVSGSIRVNQSDGSFAIIEDRKEGPKVIMLSPQEAEGIRHQIDQWLPKAKRFFGLREVSGEPDKRISGGLGFADQRQSDSPAGGRR